MMTGWIQSTLIVCALALLAVLLNQMPPEWVNVFRLFNGFIISLMLVWLIQDAISYRALLLAHRSDVLNVFRHDEEKRAQEFENLRQQTEEIATRLAHETTRRHIELTQKLNGLSSGGSSDGA